MQHGASGHNEKDAQLAQGESSRRAADNHQARDQREVPG
jgi:hypothetical protein